MDKIFFNITFVSLEKKINMIESKSLVSQLTLKDLKNTSKVFRAINHPLRLEIVRMVEANETMNVTRIYIKLRIEQSVASQHLAILREAEILNFRRDGKEIHYSVNQERIQTILDTIKILKD